MARRSASSASSTRNSGSSPPPGRGCAAPARRSRGWWRSTPPRPRARLRTRRAPAGARRTRAVSCAAAFSVKVMARMASTGHAVVEHGLHEALHQHRRLAGARAGADQERAVAAVDRRACSSVGAVHLMPPPGRSRGASSRRGRRRCPGTSSVARAHALGRSAIGALRPGGALGELVLGLHVVVEEVAAQLAASSSATMPRGRRSVPRQRHVHAARRPEAQPLLGHQHVESGLEAVLLAPSPPPCMCRPCRSCSRAPAPSRPRCRRGRSPRAPAGRPPARPPGGRSPRTRSAAPGARARATPSRPDSWRR